MMPRIAIAVLSLALVELAGCSLPKFEQRPALLGTAESFRERYRTLCMEALALPTEVSSFEEVRKSVESGIVQTLEAASFRVVRPGPLEEVWREVALSEGGLFDPHTGWRNEARYQTIRQMARDEAHRKLGCDAILSSAVVVVTAPFSFGEARWDGREIDMSTSSYEGWIGALSLHVRIEDLQGEQVYFAAGGIETLADLDVGFFSAEFENVPIEKLLADRSNNALAIRTALEPLLPPELKEDFRPNLP